MQINLGNYYTHGKYENNRKKINYQKIIQVESTPYCKSFICDSNWKWQFTLTISYELNAFYE